MQSKHITTEGLPFVLKTLVTGRQWPALSPGNHRQVQKVACFWRRSRYCVRRTPRGQALESRGRSGTEMNVSLLRDNSQKHKGITIRTLEHLSFLPTEMWREWCSTGCCEDEIGCEEMAGQILEVTVLQNISLSHPQKPRKYSVLVLLYTKGHSLIWRPSKRLLDPH